MPHDTKHASVIQAAVAGAPRKVREYSPGHFELVKRDGDTVAYSDDADELQFEADRWDALAAETRRADAAELAIRQALATTGYPEMETVLRDFAAKNS